MCMRQVIVASFTVVVMVACVAQTLGWKERLTASVSGALACLIIVPPFIASQQQSGVMAIWIVILLVGITGRWSRWAFADRFVYGTGGLLAVLVVVGGLALLGKPWLLHPFLYPNRWVTTLLEQVGVVC